MGRPFVTAERRPASRAPQRVPARRATHLEVMHRAKARVLPDCTGTVMVAGGRCRNCGYIEPVR